MKLKGFITGLLVCSAVYIYVRQLIISSILSDGYITRGKNMATKILICFLSIILFYTCGINEPQELLDSQPTYTFSLTEESNVKVDVINSYNTHIKTLVESQLQTGVYSFSWNLTNSKGQKVVEGIYFFELFINGRLVERKTIIEVVP